MSSNSGNEERIVSVDNDLNTSGLLDAVVQLPSDSEENASEQDTVLELPNDFYPAPIQSSISRPISRTRAIKSGYEIVARCKSRHRDNTYERAFEKRKISWKSQNPKTRTVFKTATKNKKPKNKSKPRNASNQASHKVKVFTREV